MHDRQQSKPSVLIVVAILAVVVAAAVLFGVVTGRSNTEEVASPEPTVDVVEGLTPDELPLTGEDEGNSQLGQPDIDPAIGLEPAPLGTFVVARETTGEPLPDVPGEPGRRQIPVFDDPGGAPRSLIDGGPDTGSEAVVNLINWNDPAGTAVLRVIAGGPDDEWIVVQAPTRPHGRYVWVPSSDYEFGHTSLVIEVDLAGEGILSLIDDNEVLLESPIAQGREDRPTSTHLTYIQNGVLGERIRPAFGTAILTMASFSEVIPTLAPALGLPSNFIYGTDNPALLGEKVSSGGIRIPNDRLDQLVALIKPGTPVVIYDSSNERAARTEMLGQTPMPAQTTVFRPGITGVGDLTTDIAPQLWNRCDADTSETLLCRTDGLAEFVDAGDRLEHVYATAKPDAGDYYLQQGEEFDQEQPPPLVIPVFDEPDAAAPRVLMYQNEVDDITLDFPLFAQTPYGEPLVLSVLKMSRDGEWLLVRAPVLPHDQVVWVRGKDFELASSDIRIEVDVGYEFVGRQGIVSVWNGGGEMLSAKISAGREHRPTVLTSTYVDQMVASPSEAYGPWVFSTPSYSETLGTFGGGGMPQQAIHAIGADLDFHLGEPLSSGSIHVSLETIERMAEIDMVGARVVFYDSSSRLTDLQAITERGVHAANTKPLEHANLEQPIGTFT